MQRIAATEKPRRRRATRRAPADRENNILQPTIIGGVTHVFGFTVIAAADAAPEQPA